jgi:hypothetical protein
VPFNFKGRVVRDPLIQQNFEQLGLLIPDTKGDLLTASGTNVPAQLAVGADYKVLRALASATNGLEWGSPIEKRTSLPGSPYDGQVFSYLVDSTNGVRWTFQYNSGSASASKWEFIGGPPLFDIVTTAQTTASATYVALTTAGPAIAIPTAGDYLVRIGTRSYNNSSTRSDLMSYDIGGTGAVDGDAIDYFAGLVDPGLAITTGPYMMRQVRKSLSAVTLTAKYRTTGGTATFQDRWMEVLPIRVT